MANRDIFQMDQTTPQNQNILGNVRKRSDDASLDHDDYLFASGLPEVQNQVPILVTTHATTAARKHFYQDVSQCSAHYKLEKP